MKQHELLLQNDYLIDFLTKRKDNLGYKEVKANIINLTYLMIPDDLLTFLRETDLNRKQFQVLLRKFGGDERALIDAFMSFLNDKIGPSRNMAVFINNHHKTTFKGVELYLYYKSGSELHEDKYYHQNIHSVAQEMPYQYQSHGQKISFRPDLTFFVNGLYIGYSELKSTYSGQNAHTKGRNKVIHDYRRAVEKYLIIADKNDVDESIRREALKIWERAIHLTATDLSDTYIIRTISQLFPAIKSDYENEVHNHTTFENLAFQLFKSLPITLPKTASKTEKFEEAFTTLYSKMMLEREILYYNFLEREVIQKKDRKGKTYKERKHSRAVLIAPRPKQKFGADKILAKIDEFLEHENDDNYFINRLNEELKKYDIGAKKREELIAKRLQFNNNKTAYSLLMQYAAGFGKSNIIGWTSLMLKDLRRNGKYIYDKIMIVVDRIQLRDQLDTKMFNMNIHKEMYIEVRTRKDLQEALQGPTRIVVLNIQKFGGVQELFAQNPKALAKLASIRTAFLIDEIHRSNSGTQHEEMVNIFDDLKSSFDGNTDYEAQRKYKNLIIGFTATPSEQVLARFGEFSKYAENRMIWMPFDAYTMRQAIDDNFILDPLPGIVPVSAKMYYELPDGANVESDTKYIDEEEAEQQYRIRKKKIYENKDRINAIAEFVVKRLVSVVYHSIGGRAKAMMSVSSITAAIEYHGAIKKHFAAIVEQKKHHRFKDAPVYVVYTNSDNQRYDNPRKLNGGLSEKQVIQNFTSKTNAFKNGIIIVVEKLQTGFDEKRLQTLFLDKEIKHINAIQTISRVNRTYKGKDYCNIIDFSHKNVNVNNIKKAFEDFSNIVVSDFDPLGDEKRMQDIYEDLRAHYAAFLKEFNGINPDIKTRLAIENAFYQYVIQQKDDSKSLKRKIAKYFSILRRIDFVITFDEKFTEKPFLQFWRRYNNEYNQINRTTDVKDDVEIYFDYKIGIVAPPDEPTYGKPKKPSGEVNEPPSDYGKGAKSRQLSILDVIRDRNAEEDKIEELIDAFNEKIENLFQFIKDHKDGERFISKLNSDRTTFSHNDILNEFTRFYTRFFRKNQDIISQSFKKETKDMIGQLCDLFEEKIMEEE
jgi:type I restriction enzyme R subunit